MPDYTAEFFESFQESSRQSAREVVPLLLELLQPRAVVDVGCGVGTWLSVFHEHGIADIQGVDGSYVKREALLIPPERFLPFDLKQPLDLGRRFDLAISLEVGEHLPARCAKTLVESLVRLAPVVLFSAAIPLQGGNHHINEQWQDYWARLFQTQGYVAIDYVRPRVWRNERVQLWYAQNTLLYAHRDALEAHPRLLAAYQATDQEQLSLVHPRLYLAHVPVSERLGLRKIWSALPFGARNALKRTIIRPLVRP
ncbi:MAG: methyltransferase domain-containing protein [Ktedonobacterales bacterium]|nr:methyltransferase domain-containing protein [Ktedonobacterales bacterium]